MEDEVHPVACWPERELLGSLGLPELPQADLLQLAGLEPVEVQQRIGLDAMESQRFAAAMELGRRALHQRPKAREPIRGGEDVYRLLAPHCTHLHCESFFGLYLDTKGRLLFQQELSRGTLSSSLVHPREVFAPALVRRAAGLIVAHNHPSGDPEPSADDRTTTRRLQRAGRLLGIELLDHVILGQGRYSSFLEEGWL